VREVRANVLPQVCQGLFPHGFGRLRCALGVRSAGVLLTRGTAHGGDNTRKTSLDGSSSRSAVASEIWVVAAAAEPLHNNPKLSNA